MRLERNQRRNAQRSPTEELGATAVVGDVFDAQSGAALAALSRARGARRRIERERQSDPNLAGRTGESDSADSPRDMGRRGHRGRRAPHAHESNSRSSRLLRRRRHTLGSRAAAAWGGATQGGRASDRCHRRRSAGRARVFAAAARSRALACVFRLLHGRHAGTRSRRRLDLVRRGNPPAHRRRSPRPFWDLSSMMPRARWRTRSSALPLAAPPTPVVDDEPLPCATTSGQAVRPLVRSRGAHADGCQTPQPERSPAFGRG